MIRATLDHYPERVAIGAVGVRSAARFSRYVRGDELHLAVDTRLAASRFDADEVRAAIEDCLESVGSVGAAAPWLLSDHDLSRPASRYGAGVVGRARARAMALVQLALPGAAYVYNGDELGLPDADLPDEAAATPSGITGRTAATAAACHSRGRRTFRRTGSPPVNPGCRSLTSTPR